MFVIRDDGGYRRNYYIILLLTVMNKFNVYLNIGTSFSVGTSFSSHLLCSVHCLPVYVIYVFHSIFRPFLKAVVGSDC